MDDQLYESSTETEEEGASGWSIGAIMDKGVKYIFYVGSFLFLIYFVSTQDKQGAPLMWWDALSLSLILMLIGIALDIRRIVSDSNT